MHISKVTYGATYPTGAFQNEKFMVEYELVDGDNASEAMELARKFVMETHIKNNPHLFDNLQQPKPIEVHPETEPITQIKRPRDQVQGMIFDIQSVTELTVLKSYELLCKNNPILQEAYQAKLKQLTQ